MDLKYQSKDSDSPHEQKIPSFSNLFKAKSKFKKTIQNLAAIPTHFRSIPFRTENEILTREFATLAHEVFFDE